MRRPLFPGLFVFVFVSACVGGCAGSVGGGSDDDFAVFDFADPFVVNVDDDRGFVGFATNSGEDNVPVATSTDLVHWRRGGDALPELPVWALADAGLTWAPAVLPRGEGFVLYFTARDVDSGFQCIGRATSSAAAGPYVDDTDAPLICQVDEPEALCGSIDPSPFVDDNGAAWLVWKSDENAAACQTDSQLFAQQLSDDGLALVGPRASILRHSQDWEDPLIEGPALVQNAEGDLVLFYSAGRYDTGGYATGYATCDAPLGPCTTATVDGPWLSSPFGPGGGEVVSDDEGALFFSHHAWTEVDGGGVRVVVVEPLSFDAAGAPQLGR